MIWLWLYIASFFITAAVTYHFLIKDRFTSRMEASVFSMLAGVVGPAFVIGAIVIIPVRILSVRIGPYIDNIIALTKEGK